MHKHDPKILRKLATQRARAVTEPESVRAFL